MMEEVKLCAVWPMENWLGSSLNQIQGWTPVRESYSRALEQGSLALALPAVVPCYLSPVPKNFLGSIVLSVPCASDRYRNEQIVTH